MKEKPQREKCHGSCIKEGRLNLTHFHLRAFRNCTSYHLQSINHLHTIESSPRKKIKNEVGQTEKIDWRDSELKISN